MKKKIFICEFVTGGGYFGKKIPKKLFVQAEAIINSLLKDFSKIPNLEIIYTRDSRFKNIKNIKNTKCFFIRNDPWKYWKLILKKSNLFIPIAPETNNELFKIIKLGLLLKKRVIANNLDVVKITSSKFKTYKFLKKINIPTVSTYTNEKKIIFKKNFNWVVKPDDGAGCEKTYLFNNEKNLKSFFSKNKTNFIIQPLIEGSSFSANIFVKNKKLEILNFNKQIISLNKKKIVFEGTKYIEKIDNKKKIEQYIKKIIRFLPQPKGFLGIDFIKQKENIIFIDINPRITTSYKNLSKKIKINIAKKILNNL